MGKKYFAADKPDPCGICFFHIAYSGLRGDVSSPVWRPVFKTGGRLYGLR
ncbi:MAG: hypothetical protein DESF_02121 [Desulfovibrio sp.]